MPRKTYYKVVRKTSDGKRVSAWLYHIGSIHSLEYPKNTRVEADPMSAGIFVFDNAADAENFAYSLDGCIVILVHGHGRPKRYKAMPEPYVRSVDDYFYIKSWGGDMDRYIPPCGTVCFKAITTLE